MNSFQNLKKVFVSFLISLISISVFSSEAYKFPPNEANSMERLDKSPRHGEWITYTAGKSDKVDAWIVYPEIKEKAPIIIVIHEIFGLSDWIRAVADQLAAEGFIAIAPDFISGKYPAGKNQKTLDNDSARKIISALDKNEVNSRLDGAVKYAADLKASNKKYSVLGFCWGGGMSFQYATYNPGLSGAVVYYGTSPETGSLKKVKASILGLYGGNDNRVNATIQAAEDELKKSGKRYEKEIYEGAGHAFLRQQEGQDGANMKATEAAWPRTIKFLKEVFQVKALNDERPEEGSALAKTDDCCDPVL